MVRVSVRILGLCSSVFLFGIIMNFLCGLLLLGINLKVLLVSRVLRLVLLRDNFGLCNLMWVFLWSRVMMLGLIVIFLVILLLGFKFSLVSCLIFSFWYINGVELVVNFVLFGSFSFIIMLCWLWVRFLYRLKVFFVLVGFDFLGELKVIVLLISVVRFFSFIFVLLILILVLMLEMF